MGNISAEVKSVMCPEMYCRKLSKVKADPGHEIASVYLLLAVLGS